MLNTEFAAFRVSVLTLLSRLNAILYIFSAYKFSINKRKMEMKLEKTILIPHYLWQIQYYKIIISEKFPIKYLVS